jgi:hypothetical protein
VGLGQENGGSVAKSKKPFLSDIQEIRRRAREHMESGAVTGGYRADREMVIKLLNEALATEIVCVLRSRFWRSRRSTPTISRVSSRISIRTGRRGRAAMDEAEIPNTPESFPWFSQT